MELTTPPHPPPAPRKGPSCPEAQPEISPSPHPVPSHLHTPSSSWPPLILPLSSSSSPPQLHLFLLDLPSVPQPLTAHSPGPPGHPARSSHPVSWVFSTAAREAPSLPFLTPWLRPSPLPPSPPVAFILCSFHLPEALPSTHHLLPPVSWPSLAHPLWLPLLPSPPGSLL